MDENTFTLSNVISSRCWCYQKGWIDWEFELTNEQKTKFVEIFGKRCSSHTRERLWHFINNPTMYADYAIYERVVFQNGSYGQPCQYVAGQSHLDEIREIRRLIMKG